jgi:prolyl oligopeptidase
VTTQRPELFRAVIVGAPVLDMIRYPLFGSGKTWVNEYGDPNDPDDIRALIAYSPIHRVAPGTRYPSVLVMSPADDDRADPMHARKFVAALQTASTGGPVLLRVDANAGHFGTASRGAWAEYYADCYAFALAEIADVGGSMGATR